MTAETARARFHQWVVNHDDSWLFIVLYITLAVVLSMAISLFWLVIVVAAHGALEWYCHWRGHPSLVHTAARVAWEIKLDIGLVLFALALGVYMEVIFGIAGLSAAARGVQGAGRFIAWQRALRGFMLTLDDAAMAARAATGNNKQAEAGGHTTPPRGWGGWTGPWTFGDRLSLGFAATCLALLLSSPWLSGLTPAEVLGVLAEELHPWP